MRNLLPKSSTILFFSIFIFIIFTFLSYKLILKNLQDNHIKNQKITFYQIQKETNDLLTKLLYRYSKQKEVLLNKHKEVLDYLEGEIYTSSLEKIYEKINKNNPHNPYNIYITDENLIIKNTTYMPDMNFDLTFAKELFKKHKKENIIGISPPIFEMHSLKFFSYTDSYLYKNNENILQVSYTYNELNNDLINLINLINLNSNIKDSTAFIIFEDGYIGDFIFKSLKSHKPTLKDIEKRIEKGKKLSENIDEDMYITTYENENKRYKIAYFSQDSPIFSEAKIVYSIIFDEIEYLNSISKLNFAILFLCSIGIITIFIIYNIRYKENLLKYKDKFIEHSVHEIRTPLSIIQLNTQLRNKTLGEDKYSRKIEGALKTLENSYEDMTFLHTKDKINYEIENIDILNILKDRIKYFEIIALTQNRTLQLEFLNTFSINISKIEITRLIDNNLSNAIKYSNIGTNIKITIKNNILEFHSIGSSIKNSKEIFKKYNRENNSVGGHGLGLSIVKDICEKYNIKVKVYYFDNNANIFSYKFNCHSFDTPKV
uniref:sensor histidine kinase n=1 Tax=Aliarcobacter sp. TaxID=2321116 RepID=UPI004047337B